MELNEKQQQGLQIAVERYKRKEKYTVISGYAGTGKSTLVKFIIANLGVEENDVVYTAFTGKACQVLQKKGNKNVRTLHKLLFETYLSSDGVFHHRQVRGIPYKIVVVDEVSMAPMSLMKMLASYSGLYIICLGDPFQLPPVDKDEDNHLLDNPHIFLDEIMRQEAESEIIQLSMKIRNKEYIPLSKGNEVQVLSKEDLSDGMLLWADQIIVATNATRNYINNRMRELLHRGDKPEDGDKVICLHNYWETCSMNTNEPIINGTIGYLDNTFASYINMPMRLPLSTHHVDIIEGNLITDSGDIYSDLIFDKKMILEGVSTFNLKESAMISKRNKGILPKSFAYGYAITGHKSQGSEWNKVLVIEENFPFSIDEHARWLYTCVTRASEKLVLIRK